MRVVRDESGNRLLVVKQSADATRVRDPETGAERYVDNDRLDPIEDESALAVAAGAVPEPVRRVVSAVHDERALGLLVELDARGPTAVRTLLAATDFCESDLHGQLAEFRAADLLAETTVAGERGYRTTDVTKRAIEHLRR